MSEGFNSGQFIIKSENDNRPFIVDRKIIDSSSLLKNICDLTNVTEPITVKCSAESLEIFIQLLNHYPSLENEHDIKFEKNLYDSYTSSNKQKLIKLIQDLCYLDCDFFLDSAADYILTIFENDGIQMDWNEIQEYLGLENDFSPNERDLIMGNEKVKYFFSFNTKNLNFPFSNKPLYLLKTDFSTPMNALIARIIKRSNEKTSYLLSLINKSLKNEVDRHPLKVKEFGTDAGWYFKIAFKNLRYRDLTMFLDYKSYEERFYNILKKRKIIVAENVSSSFGGYSKADNPILNNSLNFVYTNFVKISFNGSYKSMYDIDLSQCLIPSISYHFCTVAEWGIKFEEIYNHLIAKAFTKRITILTYDFFKITSRKLLLWFKKKPNSSKFQLLRICNHDHLCQEFIEFVTRYMDDNGIIQCGNMIQGIPLEKTNVKEGYPVALVKEYLNSIVIKKHV